MTGHEGAISFSPGYRKKDGGLVLGRIVVHDRVVVESKVLPCYFYHSSFASLRRQLNYFSFVRLGKGRQRESTYVNDGVVVLNDILALKRRSTGSMTKISTHTKVKDNNNVIAIHDQEALKESVISLNSTPSPRRITPSNDEIIKHRAKRRRQFEQLQVDNRCQYGVTVISPSRCSLSPTDGNLISEDDGEHLNTEGGSLEQQKYSASTLTDHMIPLQTADNDVLQGCNALLELAGGKIPIVWE